MIKGLYCFFGLVTTLACGSGSPAPVVAPERLRPDPAVSIVNSPSSYPVRFFRTCEPGLLSDSAPVLNARAGIVADCGRLFDLRSASFLGAVPVSDRLLFVLSEARGLYEAQDGGVRLLGRDGRRLAESPGGSIAAVAVSPDGRHVATIEGPHSVPSTGLVPAPDTPLAARLELELVVRTLPELRRTAGRRLNRGLPFADGPTLAFLDEGSIVHVEAPGQLTVFSLATGAVQRWSLPSDVAAVRFGGAGRLAVIQRDQSAEVVAIPTLEASGKIPIGAGLLRGAGISPAGEWLLVSNGSELEVHRKGPTGYGLFERMSSLDAASHVAVDGDCAAVTLGDGMLVARLGAPWLEASGGKTSPELRLKPGPLFVPEESPPKSLGERASFRPADGDAGELTFEALPRTLLDRRAREPGRSWVTAAVEYALRAEPSTWPEPRRPHVAWVTPEGARALELYIGLRPGETCSDRHHYVRVQETAEALVIAHLAVAPGAENERVRTLLEQGFDRSIGAPPSGLSRPPYRDDLRPCP